MKTIIFITFTLFSFVSFAFDKFDVVVCEAQSNNNARINCYKNLDASKNECAQMSTKDELGCYRNIANKNVKVIKPEKKKKLPGIYFVSTETIDVKLGTSDNSKITNTLYEGAKVEVMEIKNGWGRISKYYNGAIESSSGQVARWVEMIKLSSERLKENSISGKKITSLEIAIKSSDNFSSYKNVMLDISQKLINQGRCTLADYREMGGWMRSYNHKPKPIFFTYCGGMKKSNRVYLNAINGYVFK